MSLKLSSLRERQAGRIIDKGKQYKELRGKRFVVIGRVSEDRSSGITDVQFEEGFRHEFIWDYEDPLVECLGTGRVETKVIFD